MFIRVSDPHEVLDEALKGLLINDRPPVLVKSRLLDVSSRFVAVRILIVAARSVAMTADVIRAASGGRHVVAREFWNVPLLLMAPVLIPWRKRILWNVNHNLRSDAGACPLALSLAARLGFIFLMFDGSVAMATFPVHVQRAFLTPLFPVIDRAGNGRARGGTTVSLVGDMRPEKVSIPELELVVRSLAGIPGVTVQIGARGAPVAKLPTDAAVADTSKRESYLDLLRSSDVVVVLARREAYYYRHSGTVLDAIACGAWPVVPAFPVLGVQVGQPVRVGSTYESISEIVSVVKDALASPNSIEGQRAKYFAGRGSLNLHLGERPE
jgi:hypothetical protein